MQELLTVMNLDLGWYDRGEGQRSSQLACVLSTNLAMSTFGVFFFFEWSGLAKFVDSLEAGFSDIPRFCGTTVLMTIVRIAFNLHQKIDEWSSRA